MAQENIKITLPQSGIEAVIRPYVRRKDEKRVNSVFYNQTMDIPVSADGKTKNDYEMKFDMSKIGDVDDMQIVTMLISLDGKTDFDMDAIEELHVDDYKLLLDETNKIFGDKRVDKQAEREKK